MNNDKVNVISVDQLVEEVAPLEAEAPVTADDEAFAAVPQEWRDAVAAAMEALAKTPLGQLAPGTIMLRVVGEKLLTFPEHYAKRKAAGEITEPKPLDEKLAAMPAGIAETLSKAVLALAADSIADGLGTGGPALRAAATCLRQFDKTLAGVKAARQRPTT